MRPPRRVRRVYEVPEVEVDVENIVTLDVIADRYGLSYWWVKELSGQSLRAHREGRARTTHLPTPERYVGGSPVWDKVSIDAWWHSRPGKGAPWSGRPLGSRDRVKRKPRSDRGVRRGPYRRAA